MQDKTKTIKSIFSAFRRVEETVTIKLCEEDPLFTGKIVIEVNCNQGGITNTELYTLRKIVSQLK